MMMCGSVRSPCAADSSFASGVAECGAEAGVAVPAGGTQVVRVVLRATIYQRDDVVDLVCVQCAAPSVDLAEMVVALQDAKPECAPLSAAVSCHVSPVGREPLNGGSWVPASVGERIASGSCGRQRANYQDDTACSRFRQSLQGSSGRVAIVAVCGGGTSPTVGPQAS